MRKNQVKDSLLIKEQQSKSLLLCHALMSILKRKVNKLIKHKRTHGFDTLKKYQQVI